MARRYPNAHEIQIADETPSDDREDFADFIRTNCRRGDYSTEYQLFKKSENKWMRFLMFKFADDKDAVIFKLRFVG